MRLGFEDYIEYHTVYTFCVLPLSFHIMYVKYMLFHSISVYHTIFIHSTIVEHLLSFLVWAIMNTADMDILIHVF